MYVGLRSPHWHPLTPHRLPPMLFEHTKFPGGRVAEERSRVVALKSQACKAQRQRRCAVKPLSPCLLASIWSESL